MTQVNRLPGGLVDRSKPLSFSFDGTVTNVPLDGASHEAVSGTLPTGLDDDDHPIVYTLDGDTPTE